jgi:hypothetical protein
MHVVVQVFALAEPDLDRTLDAYAACDVPPFVSELRYEACVTPWSVVTASNVVADDTSTLRELLAHDIAAARRHPVFELVETPAGKLVSRNRAHGHAFDAGADVLVVGDGDAPPLSADYLEQLLRPLTYRRVIATNARPVAPWTPIGAATNAVGWLQDAVMPHVNGQGHALSRAGWQAAGPFDEAAEAERMIRTVRREEEFAFRRRLEAAGTVVDVEAARVYNDVRRTRCRLRPSFRAFGIEEPAYCARIGVESFGPRP